MNTYSLVHTYHEHDTGKLCHLSIKGHTYATVQAAYAFVMQSRRNYKPGDRRHRWCVWENFYPIDLAYEAMGIRERAAYDGRVSITNERIVS